MCLLGLVHVGLQKATAAVERGGDSICYAAEKYGIPRSKFHDHVSWKI